MGQFGFKDRAAGRGRIAFKPSSRTPPRRAGTSSRANTEFLAKCSGDYRRKTILGSGVSLGPAARLLEAAPEAHKGKPHRARGSGD